MEEVPKFKNRAFKHDWLKALAAANVTLEQPIPYEQLEVEPLEFDPEEWVPYVNVIFLLFGVLLYVVFVDFCLFILFRS